MKKTSLMKDRDDAQALLVSNLVIVSLKLIICGYLNKIFVIVY